MTDFSKYNDTRIREMMREVMLNRRTFFEELKFGREFVESLRVEGPQLSQFADECIVRFYFGVFGETLDEIEVQYPADWWQALRERWFPAWWLRRWPVQYTARTLRAEAVYPKVSAPDVGEHVVLSVDGIPKSKGAMPRLEPV